jgi:hypothetical protein
MNIKTMEAAKGAAKAHIENNGFQFTIKPYKEGVIIEARKGKDSHMECLVLTGMTEKDSAEYVHCRVHAMAAKIIASKYPTNNT